MRAAERHLAGAAEALEDEVRDALGTGHVLTGPVPVGEGARIPTARGRL